MALTFRAADVEGIGNVAGQAHMQGAAEAFVVRLGGRVGHYTVRVVEFPTKRDYAALHPISGLLTHEARVNA